MSTARTGPPAADLAAELGSLGTGLGILTIQLFPIAVPLLILVVAPLLLLAAAALLLAIPIVLPVWLVRVALRHRPRRRQTTIGRVRQGTPSS